MDNSSMLTFSHLSRGKAVKQLSHFKEKRQQALRVLGKGHNGHQSLDGSPGSLAHSRTNESASQGGIPPFCASRLHSPVPAHPFLQPVFTAWREIFRPVPSVRECIKHTYIYYIFNFVVCNLPIRCIRNFWIQQRHFPQQILSLFSPRSKTPSPASGFTLFRGHRLAYGDDPREPSPSNGGLRNPLLDF